MTVLKRKPEIVIGGAVALAAIGLLIARRPVQSVITPAPRTEFENAVERATVVEDVSGPAAERLDEVELNTEKAQRSADRALGIGTRILVASEKAAEKRLGGPR